MSAQRKVIQKLFTGRRLVSYQVIKFSSYQVVQRADFMSERADTEEALSALVSIGVIRGEDAKLRSAPKTNQQNLIPA